MCTVHIRAVVGNVIREGFGLLLSLLTNSTDNIMCQLPLPQREALNIYINHQHCHDQKHVFPKERTIAIQMFQKLVQQMVEETSWAKNFVLPTLVEK